MQDQSHRVHLSDQSAVVGSDLLRPGAHSGQEKYRLDQETECVCLIRLNLFLKLRCSQGQLNLCEGKKLLVVALRNIHHQLLGALREFTGEETWAS